MSVIIVPVMGREYIQDLIFFAALFLLVHSQQYDLSYLMREEQSVGTYVGNVAKDSLIYSQFSQLEFQKLQYSMPPTVTKLTIDSKTSSIRTDQVIDREKECDRLLPEEPCNINFDVSVYRVNSDGSFNLLRIIKVKLTIEDVNDNAPVFPSNQTTLDIPENLEVNQVLRMSGATDKDTGVNNTVQMYSLEGGMDVFGLQVMQNTGGLNSDLGIVLKKILDREIKAFYQLKIIAQDGGVPKLSGSVDVVIRVIDVNDNTPQFRKKSFDIIVPEDKAVGTIIFSVVADDPDEGDNGRLTYTFSTLTSSKVTEYLAISENTGDIYLAKRLDYERDKLFRFAVTVSDNGSPARTSQASVQITVHDVNDNAPKIDVTLPSPLIKESMGIGNYIAHVSLSDLDSSENSQISCTIANDRFMLQKFSNSDSIYTVVLRAHLDYEKSRTELVNVTCHDGGQPPLYNSTIFTIYVQDVNDNAPVFTRMRYQTNIDEDNQVGDFLTQVQAIDPDEGNNGNVTYILSKNPDRKFQINPLSGVIKVMRKLDREDEETYELEVTAKDQGSNPISSSVTVTVYVGDLNDNPPQFQKPYFHMSVQENQPKRTVFGYVVALDPDTDVDNHLRYKFVSNFTYSDIFGIDRLSGSIYTLAQLDREAKDTYHFEVMVFDESEPNFFDVCRVTVIVTDDNDNRPNITFPTEYNNTVQFAFTLPPGSFVLGVDCDDIDAGENGTVRFSIARGNEKGLFYLNAVNGELIVAKRLNIFDAGSYRLAILARDEGQNYLESTREINIIVTVANGTASYLQEEESRANMAIVIALICITAILAISVLITICIIRKVDTGRKQQPGPKCEEENMYKQQAIPETPITSPARGSYDNEIEKLKRMIRRDMSFAEDSDVGQIETADMTTKSSFTTFRNTPGSEQKNLSHTVSPSDANKRLHYVDKGAEIDRITATSSPSRIQQTSSAIFHQSGGIGGTHWSGSKVPSKNTTVKFPTEDSASHSSGNTSDSGRGGSSEEGEGHGHSQAMLVAIGDGDRSRIATSTYNTPAQLVTFGSPKSSTSFSSLSHQPRSLSTSGNSETIRKRLWGDTPTTSTSGTTMSTGMSLSSPLQVTCLSETSFYKPNISFSDDSVTANATVGNSGNNTAKCEHQNLAHNKTGTISESSPGLASMYSQINESDAADVKHLSPKRVPNLASTHRQKSSPTLSQADTSLAVNISRIPIVESSARHGMYVEGVSMLDPAGSNRSRSFAHVSRMSENNTIKNHSVNNSVSNKCYNSIPSTANNRSPNSGYHSKSPRKVYNDTQNTSVGKAYSYDDMRDVLDETKVARTHHDDDNTTTTSGSYTINADDLCQEIDHLFFNDVIV